MWVIMQENGNHYNMVGTYWEYVGGLYRYAATNMESQMDNKMDNQKHTGLMLGIIVM